MSEISPPSYARVAGQLYLIPMLVAPFSMMYVPSRIVVAGDAAATTANLLASEALYRLGVASDAGVMLAELALTAVLYFLLKPAGRGLALTATFARLGMTVLQAANLLPAVAALELAHTNGPFDAAQSQALALFSLRLHEHGVLVWQILFGFHCALIGVLVFRSGFFPRFMGVLLGIAAFGYTLNGFGDLLAPAHAATFAAIVGLTAVAGEVPFVFWLLIKGVDEPRWRAAQAGRPVAPGQGFGASPHGWGR